MLRNMFFNVKLQQIKCFISNCWQNKFNKLCQIVWCQIVLVLNCLFFLLVPNFPLLNCSVPNFPIICVTWVLPNSSSTFYFKHDFSTHRRGILNKITKKPCLFLLEGATSEPLMVLRKSLHTEDH